MCLEKDEEQVCLPAITIITWRVRAMSGFWGGKCSDAYTSKHSGVIKQSTDYKMREAKQRGRILTTGWGTAPYHPLCLHSPLPENPEWTEWRQQKTSSEVAFYARAKACTSNIQIHKKEVEIFCQTQVSFWKDELESIL